MKYSNDQPQNEDEVESDESIEYDIVINENKNKSDEKSDNVDISKER